MTCVAGIVKDGHVWIGSDSAGVSGSALRVRADDKVFRNGPAVFGFTSSFRMGQLLRYTLAFPEHPAAMVTAEFMATRFVDAVRRCLQAGGCLKTEAGVEECGQFLVGYRGELFGIHGDHQVAQAAEPFDAVGGGGPYALGALHATASRAMHPRDRVKAALQAAERFCSDVRRPFKVLKLNRQSAPGPDESGGRNPQSK